ncbi:MAG: MFS transporter, partial [Pseudomonadota bacterium]|nr:MFS transporter [Pseudomonadota bacterium]
MNSLNTTPYSNRELLTLVLIGITGSAAVNILPFIVNAFTYAPGLDVPLASQIASIELLALTVVSLTYKYWKQWGTYKQQVVVGISLYCLGNLAIVLWPSDMVTMSVFRAVAGFGAGAASAVAFAAIARQDNPDGIFAILIFFQVLWSAAGSFAMPVLMESVNWNMAFAYMLVFGLFALLYAVLYIPDLTVETYHSDNPVYTANWVSKTMILSASIIWYVALGLFWGNSAQTGTEIGVSPVMLGAIFSFGYLVSLSGNGVALWLSRR